MSEADQSAGGGTTISFQNVRAQQINTAGRDMIVSTGAVGGWNDAQEQLSTLRGGLDAFGLPPAARRTVEQTLDQAEAESRSAHPDKAKFAQHIESITSLLRSTGALVSAGAEAVAPLHALAVWLGPLGATAARLLTQ
jgi:hypothetical protein